MPTLHNQTDDGSQIGGDPFADLMSDDLGPDTYEPSETPGDITRPRDTWKAAPAAADRAFVEPCSKCGGSGAWTGATSLGHHRCTRCGGTGKQVFRTSAEQRAKARQGRTSRLQARAQAKVDRARAAAAAWAAEHELESAWIAARRDRFDFARSMHEAVMAWGRLTDGQLAAVRRLMAQDAERAKERTQAADQAPTVDTEMALPALEQAFSRAIDKGIRNPKVHLDGLTLSPAKATSANAGAIYVKAGASYDAPYLGKVLGGRFLRSRDCDDDTQAKILEAMRDPLAAAVAYGQRFGRCAICARDLTDPESIERGIGPVCAERMGW